MENNTKKTTAPAKVAPQEKYESNGITKMIQENTPPFVSKGIMSASNTLESFRINHFNSVFIFYPILGILLFLILRRLYRKLF